MIVVLLCLEKFLLFRDAQNDKKRMLKKILVIVGIILGALILIWIGALISGNTSLNDYSSGYGEPQSLSAPSQSAIGQFDLGTPSGLTPPVSNLASKEIASTRESAGTTNDTASRMVIKSGSLSMVVKDVAKTAKDILEYTKEKKGWVVSSTIGEQELVPYGQITIRVPAEKFDEAMEYAHGLAEKVKYENTAGEDITEQYTDLKSRLRNLEAAEEELLNIMKRSGKIDDILAVQQELTRVREQIELLKGQMQYLDQSVRMAAITVNLALSEDLLPIPPAEKWQPVYVLKQAWSSLHNALRGISYFIIWLLVYAIIWLPLAVIVWAIWKLIKRHKEK